MPTSIHHGDLLSPGRSRLAFSARLPSQAVGRALTPLFAAALCLLAGCRDECVGWTERSIDPRIRRFDGWVQIGTDGAIFSQLMEVADAGKRLRAVAMSPQSDFTVVGDAGTIRYSTDYGDTWSQPASPPVREDLFGVRYACDDESPYLIAVGDAGRILRSTTSGDTWVPMDSPTQVPLRDVATVHPDVVVAVGDGGTLLRSPDRGDTWEFAASGVQEDLLALAFESCFDQTEITHRISGIAVGRRGTVVVTRDGGESWAAVDLGLEDDLVQVSLEFTILQPDKFATAMLDSTRIWNWDGDSDNARLGSDFGAPIYWFGGASVIGDGVLYSYRSPRDCAPD